MSYIDGLPFLMMLIRIFCIASGTHENDTEPTCKHKEDGIEYAKKDGVIRAPQREIPWERAVTIFSGQ